MCISDLHHKFIIILYYYLSIFIIFKYILYSFLLNIYFLVFIPKFPIMHQLSIYFALVHLRLWTGLFRGRKTIELDDFFYIYQKHCVIYELLPISNNIISLSPFPFSWTESRHYNNRPIVFVHTIILYMDIMITNCTYGSSRLTVVLNHSFWHF